MLHVPLRIAQVTLVPKHLCQELGFRHKADVIPLPRQMERMRNIFKMIEKDEYHIILHDVSISPDQLLCHPARSHLIHSTLPLSLSELLA